MGPILASSGGDQDQFISFVKGDLNPSNLVSR